MVPQRPRRRAPPVPKREYSTICHVAALASSVCGGGGEGGDASRLDIFKSDPASAFSLSNAELSLSPLETSASSGLALSVSISTELIASGELSTGVC